MKIKDASIILPFSLFFYLHGNDQAHLFIIIIVIGRFDRYSIEEKGITLVEFFQLLKKQREEKINLFTVFTRK